jgi:hypothetical protein
MHIRSVPLGVKIEPEIRYVIYIYKYIASLLTQSSGLRRIWVWKEIMSTNKPPVHGGQTMDFSPGICNIYNPILGLKETSRNP